MKRKKANPQTLENEIRDMFARLQGEAVNVKDLIDLLSLSHKAFPEVRNIVQRLADSGFIRKDNRKYKIIDANTAEQKQQRTSPNLIEGTFDATSLARNYSFAFVRTEQGDFYVSAEDTLNAFHGDTVLIEPYYRNNKSDYCYVRRVVKRASTSLTGSLQHSSGRYYFICGNPKIHQWFDVTDPCGALPGLKVVLEVINWGNRNLSKPPVGKVTEVLGPEGNPDTELLAVIRQHALPLEFAEHLTSEIEALPEDIDVNEIRNRQDYRQLVTFTIDPSSARDFDDAISLETTESGWRLYVHIADVAHYIIPDSKLFAECLNRGNSYYFPRKVIPMLPEKLSNKVCSLRQNEDKLTMTVVTDFDEKGNAKRQSLWESVIRSNARLAYEQVDELFEGKPVDIPEAVIRQLQTARELSSLLTQKRLKAGYLFFDLPETEYVYDEEGFVHHMTQSLETESHKLIENFMLVANQFVAERLTELAPKTMYRVHELPDMEKLERLSILLSAYGVNLSFRENLNFSLQRVLRDLPDETFHRVFDRQILRSLKKAKYTTEHLPHFGLAMETYTHFTSPIRRLCDLVIHHLCKTHVLHSSNYKLSSKQLVNWATIASEKEIVADEAEREIERVMNTIYMKEHVGEVFDGIVIGMNSSSLFIQLDRFPISGVLKVNQLPRGKCIYDDRAQRYRNDRSGDFYQLMDSVRVQVMQVTDDVYFELVQEEDSHRHHVSPLTPKVTFQKRKNSGRNKQHNSRGRKGKGNEKTHRRV